MQSIKDNVSLLDEETINKINEVAVRARHRLVKKKTKDSIVREKDILKRERLKELGITVLKLCDEDVMKIRMGFYK